MLGWVRFRSCGGGFPVLHVVRVHDYVPRPQISTISIIEDLASNVLLDQTSTTILIQVDVVVVVRISGPRDR